MKVLFAMALVVVDPRLSDACSLIGNTPFEIDPSQTGVAAPDTFTVTVTYEQLEGGGTCDPHGVLGIDASPTTACPNFDATPRCGYRFTLIDGTAFSGMPTVPVGEAYHGAMVFYLDPNETVDATVEIRAVNRVGEQGPPTVVHLAHEFDDGGCSATGTAHGGGLIVLALAGLRRRRRAKT